MAVTVYVSIIQIKIEMGIAFWILPKSKTNAGFEVGILYILII